MQDLANTAFCNFHAELLLGATRDDEVSEVIGDMLLDAEVIGKGKKTATKTTTTTDDDDDMMSMTKATTTMTIKTIVPTLFHSFACLLA